MDLATIAKKTAPLSIQFEGEPVNARFYPHKMTAKYRAFLIGLENGDVLIEEQKDSAAQMAADMLESWDITYDGGEFPPTYENLLSIPIQMLAGLIRAIWDDLGKRMSIESGS